MVKTNKHMLRIFLIMSYILVISVITFLISSLFTYLNTGADRSKILHLEVKKEVQYLPKLTWAENGNEGREMDDQVLNSIENDYLDAWYVKNVAFRNNDITGIEDFYTESARVNLYDNIDKNKLDSLTIESTTFKHKPDILFFSEDGQLIVLEDKKVIEYKKFYKKDELVFETTEENSYKVILLLEDGFWRIRHMVKQSSKPVAPIMKNVPMNFTMKGINYYPKDTPWDMFGDDFKLRTIKKDFKIIRKAGLNSIRIFIPYEDFGSAVVLPEKLEKLRKVLDAAEKNELKVVVTLFDFYGNYDILDWTLNQRHLETIVNTFKDHNAILAWDLKNEPNLDFDQRGKENVISWLEQMLILVKSIDNNHAVTVGWSNTESAHILSDQLDFVSFHYYEDKANFEDDYLVLKKQIPNKELVLGEFGISSYSGLWKPFIGSPEKQATYHQEMQKVLNKNNISFLSWTLYDFESVPSEVVGKLPWRVNPQKEFGFIDIKGNKKPSFKHISK